MKAALAPVKQGARAAAPKLSIRALGVMSGTSLDGVDYALCRIGEEAIRLERLWHFAFPRRLKRALESAAAGDLSAHDLAQAHHDLGRTFADHALRTVGRRGADAAGLHGQTIFHRSSGKNPATFQLGEPAYLAAALDAPVVSNFRPADIAAGGEGAPLAVLFHQRVFALPGRHVAVQNLGGIGNITSIDWRRGPQPRVKAFDTGPGNLLIDLAIRRVTNGKRSFDRGGRLGRRGAADEDAVREWLGHPFLRRRPPKSTGREEFGEVFFNQAWDQALRRGWNPEGLVATLTEFTAACIAEACRRFLPSFPDRLVIAGGGAKNVYLTERIRVRMEACGGPMEIREVDSLGWPCQAVEPAAFALLARETLLGRPGNAPEATGAARPVVLGQITDLRPNQVRGV